MPLMELAYYCLLHIDSVMNWTKCRLL